MNEKVYKDLDNRIEILRNRGMNVRKNATREIKILDENNYYNLINGYKHLFLDYHEMGKSDNKHKGDIYKLGTKPSELHAVMKYDNAMRSIFLKEILTIENKVKHAIVQSFYESFENENLHKQFEYTKDKYYKLKKEFVVQKTHKKTWRHETEFYNKRSSPIRDSFIYETDYKIIDREQIFNTFRDSVVDIIDEQKTKKKSIKQYNEKHHYVPYWILTNILSLGNISYLFIILQDEVAFKVLDRLGIKNDRTDYDIYNFYRVLGILTLFRNICAHNERFICTKHNIIIDDYFLNYGKALPHYKDPSNSSSSLKHNQRERRKRACDKLFPLIFSISIFYSKERRDKFITKIEKETNKLSKQLKTIKIDNVRIDIGLDFDLKCIDNLENNLNKD